MFLDPSPVQTARDGPQLAAAPPPAVATYMDTSAAHDASPWIDKDHGTPEKEITGGGAEPLETRGASSGDTQWGSGWEWTSSSDWQSSGWIPAREYWRTHSMRWNRQDWDEWRSSHPGSVPSLPPGTAIPMDLEERKALFRSHNLCKWCGLGDHWGNECQYRPEEDKQKDPHRRR